MLSSPLARQVLDGYGAEYRVVELNEVQDGYALRAELADLTGRTSVPAVCPSEQCQAAARSTTNSSHTALSSARKAVGK